MTSRLLYRPVGWFELKLIQASDYSAFPSRLPEQPIFYPVLNVEYAAQIASQWNTKDKASGYMGAVMQFELPIAYLKQFETQIVGGSLHQELWVPADQLDDFNRHIIGHIEVISACYGDGFSGEREW